MGTYENKKVVKKLVLDPVNSVIEVTYGDATILDNGEILFKNGFSFVKSGVDYATLFAVNNIGQQLTDMVNVAMNIELGDTKFPVDESVKNTYKDLFEKGE